MVKVLKNGESIKKVIMIIMCTLACALLMDSVSIATKGSVALAASTKTTKQKRKKVVAAYKAMLKKGIDVEGVEYPDDTKFLVKDIDKDGVPELIVDTNYNYCEAFVDCVYSYYNGKIKRVAVSDHGKTSIYEKGNVLEQCSGNIGKYTFSAYKIVKGKAKVIAKIKWHDIKGYTYYIGGKKTTEKKYKAYIKKVTKNSKMISSKSKKWHKITNKNIDKYVK